jgi:hypothetical protein
MCNALNNLFLLLWIRCIHKSMDLSSIQLCNAMICLILLCFRCIHKSVNPCSLQLCEQRCSVYLQKVVCTCFPGYRFNAEKQKQGLKPVCEGKMLTTKTKKNLLGIKIRYPTVPRPNVSMVINFLAWPSGLWHCVVFWYSATMKISWTNES